MRLVDLEREVEAGRVVRQLTLRWRERVLFSLTWTSNRGCA